MIVLTDGEYCYWELPRAGNTAVCGEGMVWLQLYPDGCERLITVMFLPCEKGGKANSYTISAIYVDVAEKIEFDPDGVAAYIDKYLDVILTLSGDIIIDDHDELDEALACGEITEAQYNAALNECELIVEQLGRDMKETAKRCGEILDIMRDRISRGLEPVSDRISCVGHGAE